MGATPGANSKLRRFVAEGVETLALLVFGAANTSERVPVALKENSAAWPSRDFRILIQDHLCFVLRNKQEARLLKDGDSARAEDGRD